jgi:hypothetical protein
MKKNFLNYQTSQICQKNLTVPRHNQFFAADYIICNSCHGLDQAFQVGLLKIVCATLDVVQKYVKIVLKIIIAALGHYLWAFCHQLSFETPVVNLTNIL